MKIAINGFGRIGRVFYRQAVSHPDFEIVAINDLGDKENLLYLLEHDSVYGKFEAKNLKIGGIKFFQEKDPANLPWEEFDVDLVVEATGAFTTREKAQAHIKAGAKRVVITAPTRDNTVTFTPEIISADPGFSAITSNASCTTNSVTPIVAILMATVGIEKAMLTTVHAYTASQSLVDDTNKENMREGRDAAVNIIPSSTGAAKAATEVVPALKGKFDGVAVRVPVIAGSLTDLTFVASRSTTPEEINKIFEDAAKAPEWQGVLKIADKGTVSTDILGEPYGSIVDTEMTRVVDGNLVKVMAWYDNEWGYAAMLIKHIETLRKYL